MVLPNGVLLFSEEIFRGSAKKLGVGELRGVVGGIVVGTYSMKAESVFNLKKRERQREREKEYNGPLSIVFKFH